MASTYQIFSLNWTIQFWMHTAILNYWYLFPMKQQTNIYDSFYREPLVCEWREKREGKNNTYCSILFSVRIRIKFVVIKVRKKQLLTTLRFSVGIQIIIIILLEGFFAHQSSDIKNLGRKEKEYSKHIASLLFTFFVLEFSSAGFGAIRLSSLKQKQYSTHAVHACFLSSRLLFYPIFSIGR